MPKSHPVLDSSPAEIPQIRPLKRTASTASSMSSLPTPPQTTRKVRRAATSSRSRKDRSRSKLQAIDRSRRGSRSISTSREGTDKEDDSDDEELHPNPAKRQKTLKTLPEEADEEGAFWMSGASSKEQPADSHSSGEHSSPPPALTRYRARMNSRSAHSLASPPISKPAPVTPQRRSARLAASPATPRRSTRSSRKELLSSPEDVVKSPLRDSPDNPFLAGDEKLPESPETPTPSQQGEKPTIVYVFRGMRRTYANPHYDSSDPTSSRVKPQSLLPIEHPDFSPTEACKPQILFKSERRKRTVERRVETTPTRGGARLTRGKPAPSPVPDSDQGEDPDEEPPKPLKLNFANAPTAKETQGKTAAPQEKAAVKVFTKAVGARGGPRLKR